MDQSKEKKKATKDKETNPVSETGTQAMKNWEQLFQTSLKFQEAAGERWSNLLNPSLSMQEWQKGFNDLTAMAEGALPAIEKPMEGVLESMMKNTQACAYLMSKAAEAVQTPEIGKCQAKWVEFWESVLEAAQANAETFMLINTRAMDCWFELVQRMTEGIQPRVPVEPQPRNLDLIEIHSGGSPRGPGGPNAGVCRCHYYDYEKRYS